MQIFLGICSIYSIYKEEGRQGRLDGIIQFKKPSTSISFYFSLCFCFCFLPCHINHRILRAKGIRLKFISCQNVSYILSFLSSLKSGCSCHWRRASHYSCPRWAQVSYKMWMKPSDEPARPESQTDMLATWHVRGGQRDAGKEGSCREGEVVGRGVEAACDWRWRLVSHVVDPLQRCVHSLI